MGTYCVVSFVKPEIKVNTVWDTIASSIITGAHLAPNSQWEEQKAELLADMGNHTSWTVFMAYLKMWAL